MSEKTGRSSTRRNRYGKNRAGSRRGGLAGRERTGRFGRRSLSSAHGRRIEPEDAGSFQCDLIIEWEEEDDWEDLWDDDWDTPQMRLKNYTKSTFSGRLGRM